MPTVHPSDRPQYVLGDLQPARVVATSLCIGRAALDAMRERGAPALNIGGKIYFDVPELVVWITTNCQTISHRPKQDG